ncbi:hypothetical protein GW944_00395 [Candidatus Parcubacteria bacterium]|nr:hypothetical protein [Candidatus Parcubacteria bacterium]
MTKTAKTISIFPNIGYEYRTYIFWSLLALITLSLSFYIYAINSTARNIAIRQGLERQASEISGKLASLEFTYINLKNEVTIELASTKGFKEVKSPLYVSRHLNNSLSFNTSR